MAAEESLNLAQGLGRDAPGLASTSAVERDIIDDYDEHEMVCRICRMPGDEEPLYHPCKCSGSIRYVHSSCLSKWLEHSKHDSCEVMLSYRPNAVILSVDLVQIVRFGLIPS